MLDWYQTNLVDTGRAGVAAILLSFLVTFAVTRYVTRSIRSAQASGADGKGVMKNFTIGGVHVHHVVFGIILILVTGLLEFAYQPDSPWLELLGVGFGAGAALTLDEFALWLHLDDVYWSNEGRKSIDAVIYAAIITGLLVLGVSPFGLDEDDGFIGRAVSVVIILINLVLAIICMRKGKRLLGIVGVFLPLVITVPCSIRLAKPDSGWARKHYTTRPKKLARSEARFPPNRRARWDRFRDLIGGAPEKPAPPAEVGGAESRST